jgi:hypothetical protein
LDSNDEFFIKKTINFPSNQSVISLSASDELQCVAVGLVGLIKLIFVDSGEQKDIIIAEENEKATIIWTVLFV